MPSSRRDQPPSTAKKQAPTSIYLLDVTVRNVRCFGPQEQTLQLSDADGRPAQWTVILGDNGVGKTTLLQCLVALEPRRHFFRPWGSEERPLVELPLNEGDGWKIYRDCEQPGTTSIRGHVAFAGPEPSPLETAELVVPTSSRTGAQALEASRDERLRGLRCCAYGATRRMGSAATLRESSRDPSASLFLDASSLVDAEEWLLIEDYARSRGTRSALRLKRVKKVLVDLLPDVEDLRIRERPRSLKPEIEVKTPYGWVPLTELSLGYRTMIAWTVDLASRLFELYPNSSNPLGEPAVVLVDEVDLHLHPKWQRELRSHLTKRFPRAQFIVTAHSPLVAQAAENENIVLLRREGDHVVIDNDVETVRGWRVDQILTSDLFGLRTARPPEYDELIARRNALLAKGKLDTTESAVLEQLEEQIIELPAGESFDDLKAMEIIRQAAAKLQTIDSK